MSELTEAEGALAAMNRAAQTARVRAARFGSRIAVWKDGNVVLLKPENLNPEQADPEPSATAAEPKPEGLEKPQSESVKRAR